MSRCLAQPNQPTVHCHAGCELKTRRRAIAVHTKLHIFAQLDEVMHECLGAVAQLSRTRLSDAGKKVRCICQLTFEI